MGSKYAHVFAPIRIRGVDFKNRLEMAPPSPNLADRQGRVTTEFVDFFRPIARGGTAIIHVGNSVVDIKEACDEERQLDLGSDECILPLTRFLNHLSTTGYNETLTLELSPHEFPRDERVIIESLREILLYLRRETAQ